jgi:hypothetical protein
MKRFFDPCVNKIVKLIDGQAKQIDRLNARTKVSSYTTHNNSILIYLLILSRPSFLLAVLASRNICRKRSNLLSWGRI